jgi:hypothetical protein
MKKFLITGYKSGLGKFLFENLENAIGLDRTNFSSISLDEYDTIIHCAFNKENKIENFKKYVEDNILLTQKLKLIPHKKFVYMSSIDIYSDELTTYALFKKISESLLDSMDLILRCSMLIGETMNTNHLNKLKNNELKISLSKDSSFNYILMDDIKYLFKNLNYHNLNGVFDFVSNHPIKLDKVKNFFNSNTEFGNFCYNSNTNKYVNPIYNWNEYFNKSSLENLKIYYGK